MRHKRNKSVVLILRATCQRAVVWPEWSVPVHSVLWHLLYTFTIAVSIDLDSYKKKYNLKAKGFRVRTTWIWIPALLFTSCTGLGKLLKLFYISFFIRTNTYCWIVLVSIHVKQSFSAPALLTFWMFSSIRGLYLPMPVATPSPHYPHALLVTFKNCFQILPHVSQESNLWQVEKHWCKVTC